MVLTEVRLGIKNLFKGFMLLTLKYYGGELVSVHTINSTISALTCFVHEMLTTTT